ncbi:MAG: hypothetical protein KDH88_13080 [Chromatiales bacterium]|nr:hypothetical protein [Chromatiales bacterium]
MKPLLPAVLVAGLVSGCTIYSESPLETHFPYSTQQKIQAAHHWDVIAEDVAARINDVGDTNSRALVVSTNDAHTPFNHAFHNMMLTHLVQKGHRVHEQAEHGDLNVHYTLQVVEHKDRESIRWPLGYPTGFALAAGAIAVLHELHNPELLLIPAVAAAEILPGQVESDAPPTEVVITCTVMDGNRYVAAYTDLYYINAGDTANYQAPAQVVRPSFKVVNQ